MAGVNSGRVLEIQNLMAGDRLGEGIAEKYWEWRRLRKDWEDEKTEIRKYVFATDTTKTTNAKDGWRNKTTYPKLCQIRDNLHANYLSSLFSTDNWFVWEPGDSSSATKEKRKAIETYMRNKTEESRFREYMNRALYDYIDYGNVFSEVSYVRETHVDPQTGVEVIDYMGPMAHRISPVDVVFNPTGESFERVPKIVRHLKSFGELKRDAETLPETGLNLGKLQQMADIRTAMQGYSMTEIHKASGYKVDGFGDLKSYYASGTVELLVFEGDIYDPTSQIFYRNHKIIVADGCHVIYKQPIKNWYGRSAIRHTGWRLRPDNLMAMGPLDNLVGMQYRIDHLENMKADIFDIIGNPPIKVKGFVEDFEWKPKEKIFVGEEGDVGPVGIDASVMNADLQIQELERRMEESAGAPKQALGFRTPGEKTAYEVQTLDNAASRIFNLRIAQFEDFHLEPLLNDYLECARRNLEGTDLVRIVKEDGIVEFMKITKEDITAQGRLRPVGSRHAATRAKAVQGAAQFLNSRLAMDRRVAQHISGKAVAQMMQDALELDRYGIFQENIMSVELAEIAMQDQVAKSLVAQSQPINESMSPTGQLPMLPGEEMEDPGAGPGAPEVPIG